MTRDDRERLYDLIVWEILDYASWAMEQPMPRSDASLVAASVLEKFDPVVTAGGTPEDWRGVQGS